MSNINDKNLSLAIVHYNRGVNFNWQYNKAIDEYTKAIELDHKYVKAYLNRGVCFASLKQHNKAMEDYNKAVELESEYIKAYLNRGVCFASFDLKQYNKAIEDFTKAIEIEPKYGAYLNRAVGFTLLGQYNKAIEDYIKVKEIEPNLKSLACNSIAILQSGINIPKVHNSVLSEEYQTESAEIVND